MSLKGAIGHFKTITHHRHLVMIGCFKLGLYKQGLLHDLSKYAWVEFRAGAKYFQGDKSPNFQERIENDGISWAWLHHKGRNKHHYEYWIDYGMDGESGIGAIKMPVNYIVEMYVDRVAACKNYQKEKYTDRSALEYYERGKGKYMMLPETMELLEDMLKHLAEFGEEATNDYIRKEILHNKNRL